MSPVGASTPDTSCGNGTGPARLRVCVLQCHAEGSNSSFAELDPYRTPEVYDKAGKYDWHQAYIKKATAVQQIRDLVRSKQYDVFLNLCDGAFDEDRAGMEVVEALERYGAAYTGADRLFYEPSKETMKQVAYYHDIATPPFAFIHDLHDTDDDAAREQCAEAIQGLTFPLIVKHYNGYSSVGMGKDCKCNTLEEVVVQVRKFVSDFGGALVEQFIAGREFTVLVAEGAAARAAPGSGSSNEAVDSNSKAGQQPAADGTGVQGAAQPIAFVPVECVFGPGEDFKHFDLKWRDYDSMHWVAIDSAAEPHLDAALRRAAAAAFTALRGCSYGRADFRVDAEGRVYFLEMNPNCGLFYPPDAMGSADFILSLDPEWDHARFTDAIIDAALARLAAKRAEKVTEVRHRPSSGYGLYAARTVAPGQVVVRYEERPHVLVSRQWVDRNWEAGGRNRRWFDAYAYGLNDRVWVTWSADPSDWLPINHSCDPNTWLVGLDLVARRHIARGEAVTVDYATFCTEGMKPFECACGVAACRGTVRGDDYLLPAVVAAYGEGEGAHVSGYVEACRERARAQQQQQQQQLQQQDGRHQEKEQCTEPACNGA